MPAASSPAEDEAKLHEAKFLCLLTPEITHSFNSVYGHLSTKHITIPLRKWCNELTQDPSNRSLFI